jgi:hypothetical protein
VERESNVRGLTAVSRSFSKDRKTESWNLYRMVQAFGLGILPSFDRSCPLGKHPCHVHCLQIPKVDAYTFVNQLNSHRSLCLHTYIPTLLHIYRPTYIHTESSLHVVMASSTAGWAQLRQQTRTAESQV